MEYLNDIVKMNSTYNKDKITKYFIDALQRASIYDFILSSDVINLKNGEDLSKDKFKDKIQFDGNYFDMRFYCNFPLSFSNNRKDMEYLIVSYVNAINNADLYLSGERHKYSSTVNAIFKKSIGDAVEAYNRYGTPFCLCKIEFGSLAKNSNICNHHIKDIVRKSDDVFFSGQNSAFILFKKMDKDNSAIILDKIKNLFPGSRIGIAQWKSNYVVADLFSEVENDIVLKNENEGMRKKEDRGNKENIQELNKLLNGSINKSKIYVLCNKNGNALFDNLLLNFSYEGKNIEVYNNLSDKDLSCLYQKNIQFYVYNGDDSIAEDILNIFV